MQQSLTATRQFARDHHLDADAQLLAIHLLVVRARARADAQRKFQELDERRVCQDHVDDEISHLHLGLEIDASPRRTEQRLAHTAQDFAHALHLAFVDEIDVVVSVTGSVVCYALRRDERRAQLLDCDRA